MGNLCVGKQAAPSSASLEPRNNTAQQPAPQLQRRSVSEALQLQQGTEQIPGPVLIPSEGTSPGCGRVIREEGEPSGAQADVVEGDRCLNIRTNEGLYVSNAQRPNMPGPGTPLPAESFTIDPRADTSSGQGIIPRHRSVSPGLGMPVTDEEGQGAALFERDDDGVGSSLMTDEASLPYSPRPPATPSERNSQV